MPHFDPTDDCQKPGCTDEATQTYHGEHGNTLEVCETHYYRLVSDSASSTVGIGSPIAFRPPDASGGAGWYPSPADLAGDDTDVLELIDEFDDGPHIDDLVGVVDGSGSEDVWLDKDTLEMERVKS